MSNGRKFGELSSNLLCTQAKKQAQAFISCAHIDCSAWVNTAWSTFTTQWKHWHFEEHAEFACIIYLGSLSQAIDVIIKFVALASIAKVDDFYASALPEDGNKIKKKSTPLKVHVHKRDWQLFSESSELK